MTFDGQVVRPNQELRELYDDYVCLRVTDMRGVDLSLFEFDYDLTFSLILLHPDGTVYHRYGGRDERNAEIWLSETSLAGLLESTLEEHRSYAADPDPASVVRRRRAKPRTIEDVDGFGDKDSGGCVHCHEVLPVLHADGSVRKGRRKDDIWFYPHPTRIGITLDDVERQNIVSSVVPETPASKAGVQAGDRLLAVGEQSLATATDLMWVLDRLDPEGDRLEIRLERDGEEQRVQLELPEGWKEAPPEEYAWRNFVWALEPSPGFSGPDLTAAQKRKRGLAPETFAFEVEWLVTWGDMKKYGQAAKQAGIKKGDVVLGTSERRDFADMAEFGTWWRFNRSPGDRVQVVVLRGGREVELALSVPR